MKLEMRNALPREHSPVGQQLFPSPLETDETRRVDTVAQIDTHRSDRCAITKSKSDRMDHIVELVAGYLAVHNERLLFRPEADAARP